MHNDSPSVLVAGAVIDGYKIRHQPTAFQPLLEKARRAHGHAVCLCRSPHLKLQLRERSGRIHLAAWPDQGNLHSVTCPFYSEREQYTASNQGIASTDDGRTEIQYSRPLSYNGLAPTAERPKAPPHESSPVRLWGLLHHLWESTGLNRWLPGWRRDWGFVRNALDRTAQHTWINQQELSKILYIPRPFSPAVKQSIEAQWQAFVAPLQAHHRGSSEVRCGFILGVVRTLDPHAKGFLLRLAHHGQPILLPSTLATNLASNSRRGWASLTSGTDSPKTSSVVAMLRVECSRNGLMVAADCVLMRTTRHLIPSNNHMEDQVAKSLVEGGHEFIRPLPYSQVQGDLPAFVMREHDASGLRITEMFCLHDSKNPYQHEARVRRHAEQARSSGHGIWVWAFSDSPTMPDIPEPTAKQERE